MGYVIQDSLGSIRLFPTEEAALRWERRKGVRRIVAGAEVSGAAHYRGPIPRGGVHFGPCDQSHAQLVAALAGGSDQ